MATELEASKLLLYKAADVLMNGGDANKYSAMANINLRSSCGYCK